MEGVDDQERRKSSANNFPRGCSLTILFLDEI